MKKSLFAFIALIALLLTACESTFVIVHGLTEQDANEIAVLLEKESIPAFKLAEKAARGPGGTSQVMWDIAVHNEDKVAAMAILSAYGLPRKYSPDLLQLFAESGLVPSDMSEKVRYQAGLAASIADTIRKIDGIVDADAIISFPEENPLNPTETKKPITATVFVKHTGILDDPNSHIVSKIKQLVSSAVTGLSYGNVTVVADRSMLSLPLPQYASQASRENVEVWGLVIAESSLKRFQVIFLCLFLVILLLALGVVWVYWKLHPILRNSGGSLQLLSLAPIHDEYEVRAPEPPQEILEEKPLEEPQPPKEQENVEQ